MVIVPYFALSSYLYFLRRNYQFQDFFLYSLLSSIFPFLFLCFAILWFDCYCVFALCVCLCE